MMRNTIDHLTIDLQPIHLTRSTFLQEIAKAKKQANENKAVNIRESSELEVMLPIEREDGSLKYKFGERGKKKFASGEATSTTTVIKSATMSTTMSTTMTAPYVPRTTESARRRAEETRNANGGGGGSRRR